MLFQNALEHAWGVVEQMVPGVIMPAAASLEADLAKQRFPFRRRGLDVRAGDEEHSAGLEDPTDCSQIVLWSLGMFQNVMKIDAVKAFRIKWNLGKFPTQVRTPSESARKLLTAWSYS